mgnify:CR=1 FL=1
MPVPTSGPARRVDDRAARQAREKARSRRTKRGKPNPRPQGEAWLVVNHDEVEKSFQNHRLPIGQLRDKPEFQCQQQPYSRRVIWFMSITPGGLGRASGVRAQTGQGKAKHRKRVPPDRPQPSPMPLEQFVAGKWRIGVRTKIHPESRIHR